MSFSNVVEAKWSSIQREVRIAGSALLIMGIALVARYGVVSAQEENPECATDPRVVELTGQLVDGKTDFSTCNGADLAVAAVESVLMGGNSGTYIGPDIRIAQDEDGGDVVTIRAEVSGAFEVRYYDQAGNIVTVVYGPDEMEVAISQAVVVAENVPGEASGGLAANPMPELPTPELPATDPAVEQETNEALAEMDEELGRWILLCGGGAGILSVALVFLAALAHGSDLRAQSAQEMRKRVETANLKNRAIGHAVRYLHDRLQRAEDAYYTVDADWVEDVTDE